MEIIEVEGFKGKGRFRNKTQIVLTHTGRPLNYYMNSLKKRYNGNYDKLPHYVISKEGKIYQILENNSYSLFFPIRSFNKKTIIISLENLGWLKKIPLETQYINWIGDKVKDNIYKRKWRGYHLWDKYTEEQLDSLKELVQELNYEFNIPMRLIGHNVKVDNPERFNGITSRSNYEQKVTDLSPAFDFELFISKLKS
jgi:N-acetyl-anhydromuramyl-L-alanine amidase AmpD